ncbi:hypothetical protein [Micromonospora sp. NPDC005367]|uniref:hypothetical protein n=1 Tax=Micromonospora sp. NPDC005367 TaxID=3155590 RepID=UPI0033A64E60
MNLPATGDEDVLIVSLHDEFSTGSLLHGSWRRLAESPATDLVEILRCGQEAWVPAGAPVRPETGPAALRLAADVPRLLTDFMWREQQPGRQSGQAALAIGAVRLRRTSRTVS